MPTVERPLSLRDIARMAATSPATVSRVLSGRGPVSEHMATRVMKVVRETGFSVNSAASTLARSRSDASGLVHNAVTIVDHSGSRIDLDKVPERGHGAADIFTQCNEGVLEAAERAGLSVSICLLSPEEFSGGDNSPKLRQISTDGFLVHSGRGVDPVAPRSFAPTVIYPSRPLPDTSCPVVEADDGMGIRALVNHLLDLGHRRVTFVSQDLEPARAHVPYLERRNAFRAMAEDRGFDGTVVALQPDEFRAFAQRLARLPERERPTAVVCSTDGNALRLTNHLTAHGIRVPEDISVTGFDGIPLAAEAMPPMTTWRPDWKKIGAIALQTLLSAIRGEPVAHRVLVEGVLTVRESTGLPAH